jgi:FkbM family methyltransferase
MNVARRKFEELTWALGVHRAAMRIYQVTAGRRASRSNEKRRAFYSQLLSKGQLVFDIGANLGQYANAMESAGTRVIAVEPNADCLRHIELAYAGRRIETIHAAVGERDGLAQIRISDVRDTISTMSDSFMETMKQQRKDYANDWNRTVTVPVISLDTLIRHYGLPDYIKIDVEGFEENVLDGLSSQPPLFSFEFNLAYLNVAFACLDKPVVARNSTFNFIWDAGVDDTFELSQWSSCDELKQRLTGMAVMEKYGDIFVRTSGTRI